MIDYEEELKKFEPCLDVTDAEGAIYDRELWGISYRHGSGLLSELRI